MAGSGHLSNLSDSLKGGNKAEQGLENGIRDTAAEKNIHDCRGAIKITWSWVV